MSDGERRVREYFDGKPHSLDIFQLLRGLIEQQGPCEMSIASQISFGVTRKFAWIWLYNITGANPEGTVQIMLAMNEERDEPPVYRVTPIGKSRWNHLIVVHSMDEARDPRLRALIREAYRYGSA
ncbi:DUF5655 domain-containing protein [Nocardia altamirensis]|uniref:DUF5655 domain-containing protein n=1 Tax=Nocardia altamirensis TaxID=472158 RepID=UPI00083FE132|nr:DUF5655 domain-containing protein [Nocardia altamirensis]